VVDAWNAVASNTVFVPVSHIDAGLATLPLPASVDIVKFLLTLFLSIPLGFASRYVPTGNPRHMYNLSLGIVFAQGCYGAGWLHMFFSASVSYALMMFAPRSQSHLIVFAWMMLYIGGTHIYRMYTDWLGWQMDFSGPQMMATIKITSAAFNYTDGRKHKTDEERLANLKEMDSKINDLKTKEDKESKKALNNLRTEKMQAGLALVELPTPLEYFGWVHNFSTYQAGPALEIQEYLKVNNGTIKLPEGCGKATLQQFCIGIACLVTHLVVDGAFPLCPNPAKGTENTVGVLSASFLELNILSRCFYAVASVFGVQMRYFMAWKLGEAAASAFGYGSAGGKWNGCQNIDLKAWLLADNMSVASKSWNQKTQEWLQKYTYFRYPGSRGTKILATYAVSAYWHGFYPGYYITFFTLGVLSLGQDNMRAFARPYFLPEGSTPKKAYDFVGMLGLHWVKSFATLPFLMSTFGNAWEATTRLWFLGVIFTLVGLFGIPLIPKKRDEKPADKSE